MESVQSSSSLTNVAKPQDMAETPASLSDVIAPASAEQDIKSAKPSKSVSADSIIDRVLNLLSSIPFGITLLILLITACMIGMLIQQQELETFSSYYNDLTPAEKTVYGRLGFFDIYHVWYFNLLLLLLSLNIILASIDHFPAAWSFVKRKKLTASPRFVMSQKFREEVVVPHLERQRLTERAAMAARKMGFKVRITEQESGNTIFAERGVWNRLGAYVVHIGLLTIFLGGFLTSRGFTGSVWVQPNKSADRMIQQVFNIDHTNSQHAIGTRELQLPFSLEGIDIQQKLIKKEGGLDAGNTLDWLTRVRIDDRETGKQTEALIHMNTPFDYRGYRLFQASFNALGSARSIKLRAMPVAGGTPQEITIPRDSEAKLADGTRVKYVQFNPHATFTKDGKVDLASTEYNNPAAQIAFIAPDGTQGTTWAFNEAMIGQISNAPFLQQQFLNTKPYQFVLIDFEKVAAAHMLSVQYDPGARVVYIGFTILCLTLIAIFFFSHQRLWIVVEDGKISLGGDSNRNRLGFEDRAKKLIALIREPQRAG